MPIPDPLAARIVAADLAAVDYRAATLRERWGSAADGALGRGLALPAERALAGVDPLAVVARLLGLGRAARAEDVDAALPRAGVAGLEDLGLVRRDGDGVVPLALVRPQEFEAGSLDGEWWIVSDLDEAALGGALPEDHVLGVGGASLTLAGLQFPDPVDRVLDLGAGCGIQALRAGLAARSVVATDVSQRAIDTAALTLLLNRADGVELRRGDLFAPVAGETFDRIVSNPPFVITPRSDAVPSYEYRDGGRVGDALVAEVVRGIGTHLAPGGTAQLLGNWEYRDGFDGLERVHGWIDGSVVALDAWVVEREVLDPVAYAELWIRDGGTVPGTAAFDALLGAWLDDFAARGVTAIGFGYIVLRRPAAAVTLSRYERVRQPIVEGALGAHLSAVLRAHDALTGLTDAELGFRRLRVAPDVTEARHHRPGEAAPSVIELRQTSGFARTRSVDPALAAVVGACDGDLALGVLIDAVAHLLEADAAALRTDVIPGVRELVVDGFLTLDEEPRGR